MERFEKSESNEVAELPGQWIDLSGKPIERIAPNGAGGRVYEVQEGAARAAGMIGKFNVFDGLVIVGAPDGNFKVSRETPDLIVAMRKRGYRQTTMAVPALLGKYERFVDAKTQRELEQITV